MPTQESGKIQLSLPTIYRVTQVVVHLGWVDLGGLGVPLAGGLLLQLPTTKQGHLVQYGNVFTCGEAEQV